MDEGRAIDVTVPQAGTETEASVDEVVCALGDAVEAGDVLLVLEMDKATVEVVAPAGGRVVEILVSEGDDVSLGHTLIRLEPTT